MTGRTHDLAAFTALGVVVLAAPGQNITLSTFLLAFLANQIGGIAPDIDDSSAPFWRNLPIGGYFGRIISRMLGGHRFITHSLLGLWLLGGGAWALLNFLKPIMSNTNIGIVWWAFMIGMFSHLVMDTFTKEGVPWLLPLPFKFGIPPIKALRVTTGEKVEQFVVFPAIMIFDIFICWLFYDEILAFVQRL